MEEEEVGYALMFWKKIIPKIRKWWQRIKKNDSKKEKKKTI